MLDNNRSNLKAVSNVYLRDPSLYLVDDEKYNLRIRGRENIQVMLRAIFGYDPRIDEIDLLGNRLSEEQKAQFRGLRCPYCRRLDYGWIDCNNGNMRWGRKACICQSATRDD